jgi:glycine cleavage system H protein
LPAGDLKEGTVAEEAIFDVGSYRLAEGRYYDPQTHLWVAAETAGLAARFGFDPLGSETSGDIVALSFEPVGLEVERGEAFGAIEAAKFVGPLISPVSGTIRAHNTDVLVNPALVNQAPLTHWMVELEPAKLAEEAELMISGREAVSEWFAAEVERFRDRGMVAE